jgi:hypothetical protein
MTIAAIKATVAEIELPYCHVWVEPDDFIALTQEWFAVMVVRPIDERPWIRTANGVAILEVKPPLPTEPEVACAVEEAWQ